MSPIKATHTDPECLTAAEEIELVRRERIKDALDVALVEVDEFRESVSLLLSMDCGAAYDYLQSRTRMVPYSKVAALEELATSLKEWQRTLEEPC